MRESIELRCCDPSRLRQLREHHHRGSNYIAGLEYFARELCHALGFGMIRRANVTRSRRLDRTVFVNAHLHHLVKFCIGRFGARLSLQDLVSALEVSAQSLVDV